MNRSFVYVLGLLAMSGGFVFARNASAGEPALQRAQIRPVTPPPGAPRPGLPPAPTCTAGQTACYSVATGRWGCVNLQTDNNNCGSCNNRCPANHQCTTGGCAPP